MTLDYLYADLYVCLDCLNMAEWSDELGHKHVTYGAAFSVSVPPIDTKVTVAIDPTIRIAIDTEIMVVINAWDGLVRNSF